jgi:hypothetical protein
MPLLQVGYDEIGILNLAALKRAIFKLEILTFAVYLPPSRECLLCLFPTNYLPHEPLDRALALYRNFKLGSGLFAIVHFVCKKKPVFVRSVREGFRVNLLQLIRLTRAHGRAGSSGAWQAVWIGAQARGGCGSFGGVGALQGRSCEGPVLVDSSTMSAW